MSCEYLEDRITFPDVIRGLSAASGGAVAESDFSPLPCAHPNCHQILLAARHGRQIVPISSMGPVRDNLDLISGGLSFTPDRAKQLVELFLNRMSGCGPDCGCGPVLPSSHVLPSSPVLPSVSPRPSLLPTATPIAADGIDPVLVRFF